MTSMHSTANKQEVNRSIVCSLDELRRREQLNTQRTIVQCIRPLFYI
jgi:hypothetical protein